MATSSTAGTTSCSFAPTAFTSGPTTPSICTDDSDHTVRKFTPEGKLLLTLGRERPALRTPAPPAPTIARSAAPPAPFHFPTNVALSPDGEIYVSDGYGNARIHRFSADGRLLDSWGQPGAGPGQFHVPHGIAIDRAGHRLCGRSRKQPLAALYARRPVHRPVDRRGSPLRNLHRPVPAGSLSPSLGHYAGMFPGNLPPSRRRHRRTPEHLLARRQTVGPLGWRRRSLARRAIFLPRTTSGSIRVATFMSARSTTRPASALGWSVPTATRCKNSPPCDVNIFLKRLQR